MVNENTIFACVLTYLKSFKFCIDCQHLISLTR